MTRRRWWIGALCVIVVLTIAAGVAWYTQSGLARWLLIRQLNAATNRQTTIERVDLRLAEGRLEVVGLRIADQAPGPPLAELSRLDARFDARSLLRGRVAIEEITVRGVSVRIVRSEHGALNISDLLGRRAARAGSADVTIDHLTLADGHVLMEDRSRRPAQQWRADEITIELRGISTRPARDPGSARVSAIVAGAPVSAEVSELRLAPLELRGHLAVKDADAALAGVYLPADVTAMIERARLTADVSVTLGANNGIGVDAHGQLADLELRHRRTGDALARVQSFAFTATGVRADASGRVATLGRIEATGAGTLFNARGATVRRLDVDRLRLAIEPSSPSSARVTMTAAFGGAGRLDVDGPLRLHPLGAELRARLISLDPTVLLSYVDLPAQISGVIDSDLTIDAGATPEGFSARIRGRTTVQRAIVADGGREIVKVKQIDIDGVDAQWPRVAIARIRVAQPVVFVERDQAGRVSLATLFPPAPSDARASSAVRTPSGLAVEVADIAIDDGTLTLDDATAVPPARLSLTKLHVGLRRAGWPARGPVSIEILAATPGAGTLEAKGTVSLDPVRLDIRARLAGAALAPYQGYVPFPARIQGLAHLDLNVAGALAPTVAITAKGTAALSDLAMADGDRRFVRVTRVETMGLEYTWPGTLTVDRFHVGRSRVRLVRRADGTFPLVALFTRAREPAGEAVRPPDGGARPAISVTVRDAILEEGSVRFVDEAVRSTAPVDVSDVRLVARGFTWPARTPLPIELRATAPGGGRVNVNGTLDLAAFGMDATVVLSDVDVTAVRPYVPVRARIAAKAGAELDIKARMNPFSISARGNASLGDATISDGDRPIITASRVETTGIDYAWPTKVTIDRLRVQKPRALIDRARDGTFPLVPLVTRPRESGGGGPETAPAAPLEISIRQSAIEEGTATITDAAVSPTARVEVNGIRLIARDVFWPAKGPASVRIRAALAGGGTVRARGQVALASKTLDLDVTFQDADVASVRPYLPLRGVIAGKASGELKVNATAEPLTITARGTAALAELAVSDGGRRLLTADRLELAALDYAWPATLSIDRLRVQKPWALIDRVSGQVPVLEALTSPRQAAARQDQRAAGAAVSPPASAVQLKIRRTVAESGAATLVDASVTPTARLDITDARLTLRDFAWPAGGASGFVLRAATPNGGHLEARGQLRLDTPTIDTSLVLDRADLAALQALVPVQGRIAGKANAELQIKGALTPMALSITGQLSVADASFGDAERALVTAKRVEVGGVAAQWPRRAATVQRIGIREPWALVERDANGAFPLLALVAAKPASGGAGPAPATAVASDTRDDGAARVEVGTVVIEEGFVRFSDATTRPRFVEEASRVAVTARGLGTAPASRGDIVVDARLTGGAKVEMRGTVGPIGGPLAAEIEGKLSGLALDHVNPYVNGLLGWIAQKGSVGGTTRFRIRDDHLESENEFVIGQPLFVPSRRGDEVRKRVGVPLDLLTSLLEDSHRDVRLSVPVTGTLSSRQFDFGDAVWDAIRKVAINVLALPVSWIGKIFYTADSRIDTIAIWPVSFEAGTTRMRRGIDAHAARLATFMRQTPSMAFTLKPVMTVEDVDALKREAIRERIDALTREAGSPEAAAARLYAERFPSRPLSAELTATIEELAKADPSPEQAIRALAAARVALVRQELQDKGGVNPARLRASESAVPVEAAGHGRVEFEMAPEAAVSAG